MNAGYHYNVTDSNIDIWQDDAGHPGWDTFDAIIRLLRRNGFWVKTDPEMVSRHGRRVARSYKVGGKGPLLFYANIFGRHIEFRFYQELVTENPNGGRYDFDRVQKMPYLVRMAFLNVRRKLVALLAARGYADHTKVRPANAWDFIQSRRAETAAFHPGIYEREQQGYNANDRDGVPMTDGDVRYFRTASGHLLRGRVFYNLNNMWWVLVNRDHWRNLANFELFIYDAAKHPRKQHPRAKDAVARRLRRCVEAQDFEHAIPLRDRLRQLEGVPA